MTYKLLAAFAAAGAACLGGCGTVTQGMHQDISISTTPPGARCDLQRADGFNAGSVARTPGAVHVRKSKYDITLTCSLPGYQVATTHLTSGYGIGTFGNIILGGGVGWAIDSSTGSDNKYPSAAEVTLVPEGQRTPAPAAPAVSGVSTPSS